MDQPLPETKIWDILMETPMTSIPFDPQSQVLREFEVAADEVYRSASYILWAVTVVVSLPIFVCITGVFLVLDTIAVAVEFIYFTLKRWTLRMRRGISGDRNDLVSDQLPTTNNPFVDSTPKISPRLSSAFILDFDPTVVIGTVSDEEKFPLPKIPSTSITHISDDPRLAVPPPCAQLGDRTRESDSQFALDPPPPYH
ncbi:hypothetical protein OCU04_012093 [Sclerotinia nivalis]|uniref:Transmembrane protein n=1 Tax=Sclerotinia nivalis TaxID=352851 RepID=A0A9X0DD65_9HELO|nr:hypothetical protein OCU04_012093 [Sclerotinia nivalis]